MKFLLASILALAFVSTPAQIQPVTAELGAPVYSTLPQSGGFRWVVRGHVFAPGTYTPAPGQPLPRGACDEADFNQRIGTYVIFGSYGSAGEHVAQYRVTIRGVSYVWSGLISYYEDEGGAPGSMLYSAGKLEGGLVIPGPPEIEAEYTPRSPNCFGGQVKIFVREE